MRRLLCFLNVHRNVVREATLWGGDEGPPSRFLTMRWGEADVDQRQRIVDVKLQCRDCGLPRTNFYSDGRWRG